MNLFSEAPYGPIWFEWETGTAAGMIWEDAVQQEMIILCNLVLSGWFALEKVQNPATNTEQPSSSDSRAAQTNASLNSTSTFSTSHSRSRKDSTSRVDVFAAPTRRASMAANNDSPFANPASWDQRFLLYPSAKSRGGVYGHRITQSSPTCFPSSEEPQK